MTTDQPAENTYLLDSESPTEMARLIHLDRFITKGMGGVLAGIADPKLFHDVLDLCCGPGGWVLDTAFANPHMEVAGVDISRIMVDYANARARTQQLPNASFEVMNIAQPLDFPDASFDLVNARFLFGVLPRESWGSFIDECTRILRPGGVLRLPELVEMGMSSSPALEQLNELCCQALWRVGYGFSPNGRTLGMTHTVPWMMRHAGYTHMQQALHALEYSTDCEAWADMYRNTQIGYMQSKPFFIKSGATSEEEFEEIYQQALIEMHASDFRGMWHYMTFWGNRPAASSES
jgi:ubiquinone/menaquinone biosynthesis C-methylase UbiE